MNIVGVILIFMGMKGLAEYYKDESIYSDALRGLIFLIIAAFAIAVAVPIFAISGMFNIFKLGPFGVGFELLALFLMVVLVFIFYVLAAMNLRKVFNSLAKKSGEHMFETAGALLFFGAIFTILLVGFLLIFLAWIIATIAFFSIKVPLQPYAYASQPTAGPTTQSTR